MVCDVTVDFNSLADGGGIGAEPPLPQAVAENGGAGAVGLVFFGGERAADERRYPEQGKQAALDDLAGILLGAGGAREHTRGASERRKPLERFRPVAPRDHVDRGHGVILPAARRVLFQDRDEPFGLAVRQRLQQHGVDGREDGRSRADPEREREDRRHREGAILDQRADREADVLPRVAEPWGDPDVAGALLRQRDVAE